MRAISYRINNDSDFVTVDTVLNVKSIVSETDSILISSNYLKGITVDIYPEADFLSNSTWPSSFTYYEQLGHLVDGFIPIVIEGIGLAIDNNRRLRCYFNNNFNYKTDWWAQFNKTCDYKITTSINITKNSTLSIFPNPCKGDLFINNPFKNGIPLSIQIFNSFGKSYLIEENSGEKKIHLSFSDMLSGLYYIRITNIENNQSLNAKFIQK